MKSGRAWVGSGIGESSNVLRSRQGHIRTAYLRYGGAQKFIRDIARAIHRRYPGHQGLNRVAMRFGCSNQCWHRTLISVKIASHATPYLGAFIIRHHDLTFHITLYIFHNNNTCAQHSEHQTSSRSWNRSLVLLVLPKLINKWSQCKIQ